MPKIKTTIKSLDEVATEFQQLYVRSGDEFVLDVDGSEYDSRLTEFRTNNRDLAKKLDAAKKDADKMKKLEAEFKKFEGIDPEKARAAMEQMQEIEGNKLVSEGKFEEYFAQRTERMQKDNESLVGSLNQSIEKEQATNKRLRSRLEDHLVSDSLQRTVSDVAVPRKGAMTDILSRGRRIWGLDDEENIAPRDADGNIIYGKQPDKPMTQREWAESLVMEAPYLFESSKGGGGYGNDDRPGAERLISRNDTEAISANITDIAAGKVRVVD